VLRSTQLVGGGVGNGVDTRVGGGGSARQAPIREVATPGRIPQ